MALRLVAPAACSSAIVGAALPPARWRASVGRPSRLRASLQSAGRAVYMPIECRIWLIICSATRVYRPAANC